ncbi:succinate dehydrogenase, cytochrome b556 subunit [Hephaestia mangrovi]|uniref:succinate dehydrogenase, cytochrome b556 subunit n=1 Tax=Hephaestia mangrovi TaxID=2873268 RepID=UPI001CA5F565|nr:succinate dehydrogenase, cytochrome b556 subunit [Hephaestia mangrovi]MBY8828333.1 succinate dehydrogenase, cytochrome b556 subunit [Hephaestia mangrovi]
MASQPVRTRPLSPHLTAWKWGPHMLVSILHRATGDGMAVVGTIVFVWWLAALAGGEATYAGFVDTFTVSGGGLNILGYIIGIGVSWAFFQHMASGIRHLVLDTGAGFELKTNKAFAILTLVFSILATIAFWAYLLVGK